MTGVRPTESVTAAEVQAIKDSLDLRCRGDVRIRALLVALTAGLRKGEICALKVGDFRAFEGEMCLHTVSLKKRSGKVIKRLIPLVDPENIDVLTKFIRQEHGASPDSQAPLFRTAGTRFPHRVGPMTARAIDVNLKAVFKRAGITRRLSAHSFRHSFATGLLRAGLDIRNVSELLGHSSITATEHYLHASWEHQVQGLRRLAGS